LINRIIAENGSKKFDIYLPENLIQQKIKEKALEFARIYNAEDPKNDSNIYI
jgi:hypothetical protein